MCYCKKVKHILNRYRAKKLSLYRRFFCNLCASAASHQHRRVQKTVFSHLRKQKPQGRVHTDAKTGTWVCWNVRYWKSYEVLIFSVTRILTNPYHRFCFWMHSTCWHISCVSCSGCCILVTWLIKYGHKYRKWRQPPMEQTWPKTKPRILREHEIWRLEVIHSNHFVDKGLPTGLKNKEVYSLHLHL